jgi:aminoglycoside phosphotransferase family enzyme/predicted kinase
MAGMAQAQPALPPLLRTLLDPARSPLGGGRIELMQTHASWVLLADDFAWKIKKPVVLSFLDYGTAEKRRAACSAELRLNRRFAPQLYLEVVDFDGEPAVKMRRFPEAARLDHVCQRGELRPAHLAALAATLARFHAAAAVAAADSRFGTPAAALAPALENIAELRTLTMAPPGATPRGLPAAELDALEDWTRKEHARLTPAFSARKASGCVRECHGDLHLGNLVLLGDEVVPFDCIEFNEDFRWIDVASEIAFLLVDLLDHGRPGLACWLLNAWLVECGDFDALRVLRFYMAYRALVRAKVAAIRTCQQEDGQAADCPEVRDYLALAAAIAAPPPPSLTITHGLAGCGKTTAASARLLADPAASTIRLRSDVERKRLYGLAAHAASGSPLDGGIYTADAHVRTYARLAELAELALGAGWSVVVDAAFLRRDERDMFRALAARHDAAFAILAPQAPAAELARRIEARRGSGDASEATREVLERQLAWLEPLDADEPALSS